MSQTHPPRRLLRSIGAVFAGLVAIVILSTATDMVLHATGVYPPMFQPMADWLWGVATAYRIVYGIAGSYIAARLAPDRPMLHAMVLGFVGVALSAAGSLATRGKGPEFGPDWFSFGLIAISLPCAWLGGKLHAMRRTKNLA